MLLYLYTPVLQDSTFVHFCISALNFSIPHVSVFQPLIFYPQYCYISILNFPFSLLLYFPPLTFTFLISTFLHSQYSHSGVQGFRSVHEYRKTVNGSSITHRVVQSSSGSTLSLQANSVSFQTESKYSYRDRQIESRFLLPKAVDILKALLNL